MYTITEDLLFSPELTLYLIYCLLKVQYVRNVYLLNSFHKKGGSIGPEYPLSSANCCCCWLD